MPFKVTHRAHPVGETTAGTYSETRHSSFEGVGIAPDGPVETTPEDLQAGRDVVLAKAMELAKEAPRP